MKKQFLHSILTMVFVIGFCTNVNSQSDSSLKDMPCIIYTKTTKPVKVSRIWNIRSGIVEYESNHSLHDILIADISRIQYGEMEYMFVNDSLVPFVIYQPGDTSSVSVEPGVPKKYGPDFDYTALGKAHADVHCSPVGGIMAGIFGGPTLIIPIVVAASPPAPRKKNIPDFQLYSEVPEYRKAFNKRVHGKKAIGVAIGFTGFLMTIAMTSAAW
jgi:hypothetical protein